MIPPVLQEEIERSLVEKFKIPYSVLKIQPVGGGCINNAHKLETKHGSFFLKWNDAKHFPKMFNAEAAGLTLLRSTNTIYIPEVIVESEAAEKSFLILEWIEPEKKQKKFWVDFGKKLALLHLHTSNYFGLEYDNYIGSFHQSNKQGSSWIDFFFSERIEPLLKRAIDQHKLSNRLIIKSAGLFKTLPEILPEENPSLLHGDLWPGNYLVGPDGFSCLIDPAVYFGHREMDLAMTRLFGGFDLEFYRSYDETFPLEKNWKSRVDIHNLYPLLVHVNLFGGGYAQEVNSILSRF